MNTVRGIHYFTGNQVTSSNARKKREVDFKTDVRAIAADKNTMAVSNNMVGKAAFEAEESEDSTKENPIMVVTGRDRQGNTFERKVRIGDIDLENADYVEFYALGKWMAGTGDYGEYQESDLNLDVEDPMQKRNFLQEARKNRDLQFQAGNIAGYHNAVKACSMLSNFVLEQQGQAEYFNVDGEEKRAFFIDDGVVQMGLGSGMIGQGENARYCYALYNDQSTAENPIIDIHVQASEENDQEQVYTVTLKNINWKSATQIELFALCSYSDSNQYSYTDSTYYQLWQDDFFSQQSDEQGVAARTDWIQKIKNADDHKNSVFRLRNFLMIYIPQNTEI